MDKNEEFHEVFIFILCSEKYGGTKLFMSVLLFN